MNQICPELEICNILFIVGTRLLPRISASSAEMQAFANTRQGYKAIVP